MKNFTATKLFTLAFGLFLGLTLWKFGNPVILDQVIAPPTSLNDWLKDAWPIHWATLLLLPFAAIGALIIFQKRLFWSANRWLWLLPLIWFGWQLLAASKTVDAALTSATLWQFFGCLACYFLGALLFGRGKLVRWLLIGLLAAFTFCLIRAVDQRLFEYPLNHELLVEGEREGWTNFPPAVVADMKNQNVIVSTNGADVANPIILAKFAKGRVSGTLVYPNALAGIILLLLPVSLTLAFWATKSLKPAIRLAVIVLAIFLGVAAFFWSGSKLGWLIGLGMAGIYLLRLDWSKGLKLTTITVVLVGGLGLFALRFHSYFAAGATSAGARLDYWRAAVQTTVENPMFGTGPGTFQRPYARLKATESEMARLTHNDYLEQFSDSGVIGGVAYASWILLALLLVGKTIWRDHDQISLAVLAGVLGWFIQGFGEFGLYVPALAWTAFTLLGWLIGHKINEFDKNSQNK